MPRNGEKVHRRLQGAALELFRERGYDQTTVAAIAERTGVTERTFYRHFPDKRETLFAGEGRMRTAIVDAVMAAPADLSTLQVVFSAFSAVDMILGENRAFAAQRAAIIAANPALREREVSKAAGMTAEIAAALVSRGATERLAALAAHTGVAAFDQAFRAWIVDPARPLRGHLEDAFADLRTLTAT